MNYYNTPKVSVVMAVYNGGAYTRYAVSSILNQTYTNIEFIIIDDGSTDETAEVLLQAASDKRVRLVHQKHVGLTKSLRHGIAMARGAYIARQDADDISLPRRLEVQVEFLDTHPKVGIVGSEIELIDAESNRLGKLDLPLSAVEIRQTLPNRNCLVHGATMIRKKNLFDVGCYRNEFYIAQDYDLWLRMMGGFEILNLPQVLYKYRQVSSSISQRMHTLQKVYIGIAQDLLRERITWGNDVLDREGPYSFWVRYGRKLHSVSKSAGFGLRDITL